MAEDPESGDDFRPLDPNAGNKLVNERIKKDLEGTGEIRKGLLSVLVEKLEAFKRFLRLDFLKRKKGANYMLDTDAYPVSGGQVLRESPEVNNLLGETAREKVGQP